MLITYSFDTDYVAKPCATREEAIAELNKYLEKEVETIEVECEYTPIVVRHNEEEVMLVYTNDKWWRLLEEKPDTAIYKVIEIGHNVA
jgi:hypothetical protein